MGIDDCVGFVSLSAQFGGMPMVADQSRFLIPKSDVPIVGGAAVEVSDGDTTIRTFLGEQLLQRRPVTGDFATCLGQTVQLTWPNAEEVQTSMADGEVKFDESRCCGEGCTGFSGRFTAIGSLSAPDQITYTVPTSLQLQWGGLGTITIRIPGAETQGTLATCENASECKYQFQYASVSGASIERDPDCP